MKNAELTVSAPTLAGCFARVAGVRGEAPALVDVTGVRTYTALADEVAAGVRRLDHLGPHTPVPVALPDPTASVPGETLGRTVVQMLAVLVSGRPLVPLDGALPDSRRAQITEMADVDLPGCAVLMFTSGSTGLPKAVRQGTGMWLHQIRELSEELAIGPGSRVFCALPPSFGGGLDIVLTALFSGATLVVSDPRHGGVDSVLEGLAEHTPDSLHLSPHLLRTVTSHPRAADVLSGVNLVATCGEAPDAQDLRGLRQVAPHATYVNRAGSSETGNLAFNTFPPDRPLPSGTLRPGRIAAAKTVVVRDDAGEPIGDGRFGRLEVYSPFLADGYLLDGVPVDFPADLDPTVDDRGRRHLLGDAGCVRDGELWFAGRVDDAVKIRGYLVDVSEVTAAARSVPGIADATVVTRGDVRPELVAYLVPAPGARPPALAAVRTHLAGRLPGWMRPAHHVLLPQLPRTSRGKIDRAALPPPLARPAHREPSTRTQRLLAPLWEDLLGIDGPALGGTGVGLDDDFAALGGDSLTAVELAGRIEETFGVRPSLADLTAAGTVAELAAVIDRLAAGSAAGRRAGRSDLVDLSPGSADAPVIFVFAGAGESPHAFLPLARRLPGFRLIGIAPHALERRGVPDYTVGRAVRRALAEIRRVSPHGPYRLAGHSLGGVLAMETARRLVAAGETVEHVVCLDTVLDPPLRARSGLDFPVHDAPAPDIASGAATDPAPAGDRWRTRLRLLTAGWVVRPPDQQWPLFYELARRSALLHRLRAWDGPVTVVQADDNDDPAGWWRAVAPRHSGVHRVRGDHTGMLRPPYVTATAEHLARVFASADEAG